jgi:hypothetical protein
MLVEKTAGPHSTSLRAGSPLRYASVGMTIHIWVQGAGTQENCHPDRKKVTPSRDDKGEGDASMESGCCTEGVFHHLGWAACPCPLGVSTSSAKVLAMV